MSPLVYASLNEVLELRDLVRQLQQDIAAGKEPDGDFPKTYASDRGRRMTQGRVAARLAPLEFRLNQLAIRLAK